MELSPVVLVVVVALGCYCAVIVDGSCDPNTGTYLTTCTKQQSYVKTGSRSCGLFGWSRCNTYSTAYRTVTESCYKACAVNGGWSAWSSYGTWSKCSESCGGGTMTATRTRTCTNPTPKNGGNQCAGSTTYTGKRSCNTHNCPIDGGWSGYGAWTDYDKCSVSCGGGIQWRQHERQCTNPTPQYNGKDCEGENIERESRACNTHNCPIDGGWSGYGAWTDYDKCSVSCGGGIQWRQHERQCTNPTPQYNGKDCEGESIEKESRACNTHNCPIDGGWTDYGPFSEWGPCSVTCGGGLQYRTKDRTCTDPVPQYGGKDCEGKPRFEDDRVCNDYTCPQDICNEVGTGYEAHPRDADKYLHCVDMTVHVLNCSEDTVWNNAMKTCDWSTKSGGCEEGSYLAHSTDCSKYLQCVHGAHVVMNCSSGQRWNSESNTCDHKENVVCPWEPEDDSPSSPTEEFSCPEQYGSFQDPIDCTSYYVCSNGAHSKFTCPAGLAFDPTISACNWKAAVADCD